MLSRRVGSAGERHLSRSGSARPSIPPAGSAGDLNRKARRQTPRQEGCQKALDAPAAKAGEPAREPNRRLTWIATQ
jgi:hypothetical protein